MKLKSANKVVTCNKYLTNVSESPNSTDNRNKDHVEIIRE